MSNDNELRNWVGDKFGSGVNDPSDQVSMKPMLAKLFEEAFVIAVVDSIHSMSDERKVEIFRDIDRMTKKEWLSIASMALCKNIFCRMFGTGGFSIRGLYGANASAQEVFDKTVANTESNAVDDRADVLGLKRNPGGDP